MITVLLIEDEPRPRRKSKEAFKAQLGDGVTVLEAGDQLTARKLIKNNIGKLNAVVLDGCVPGDKLNTLGLLGEILQLRPELPVVTTSSLPEYREEMIRAGCRAGAPKHGPERIVAIVCSLIEPQR